MQQDNNQKCFATGSSLQESRDILTVSGRWAEDRLKSLNLDHRHSTLLLSGLALGPRKFHMRKGPLSDPTKNKKSFERE